jgi:uncharacterized protein (TIGR02145 family)
MPSREELELLISNVGGNASGTNKDAVSAAVLRASTGWTSSSTDEYGFSALPGGVRYATSPFKYDNKTEAFFWTRSLQSGEGNVAYYMIISNTSTYFWTYNKGAGASVRCIKDF